MPTITYFLFNSFMLRIHFEKSYLDPLYLKNCNFGIICESNKYLRGLGTFASLNRVFFVFFDM